MENKTQARLVLRRFRVTPLEIVEIVECFGSNPQAYVLSFRNGSRLCTGGLMRRLCTRNYLVCRGPLGGRIFWFYILLRFTPGVLFRLVRVSLKG